MSIHKLAPSKKSKCRQHHNADSTEISTRQQQLTAFRNPFQDIPISSFLLILTPYLHISPFELSTPPKSDPFEPLGRSFGEYQDHILHIPYVAKKGLTAIHRQHIPHAGGVVVVVCDSSSSAGTVSGRLDKEKDQANVAMDVSEMVAEFQIPSLLLTVCLCERGSRIPFAGPKVRVGNWRELETIADCIYEI